MKQGQKSQKSLVEGLISSVADSLTDGSALDSDDESRNVHQLILVEFMKVKQKTGPSGGEGDATGSR